MHPIRPWILSCDKDGEIFLWDYNTNKLLVRKTLFEVFSAVTTEDLSMSFDSKNSNGQVTSSSTRKQAVNGVDYVSLSHMSRNKMNGFMTSSLSQEIQKKTLALESTQQSAQHRNSTNSGNIKKNKDFGDVHQIVFADRLGLGLGLVRIKDRVS
jgi:hypothetical protein